MLNLQETCSTASSLKKDKINTVFFLLITTFCNSIQLLVVQIHKDRVKGKAKFGSKAP
jgi:hypothetical protein